MPEITPIPDAEILEGARRITMGAPRGMEEQVRPAEVQVIPDDVFMARFMTRWVFSDDELVRMANGEPVYVTICGNRMPPLSVEMLTWELPSSGLDDGGS